MQENLCHHNSQTFSNAAYSKLNEINFKTRLKKRKKFNVGELHGPKTRQLIFASQKFYRELFFAFLIAFRVSNRVFTFSRF
jgi:hypothetical protein